MMPEFDILRPAGWPRGSCLQGWVGVGRTAVWKCEPGGTCAVSICWLIVQDGTGLGRESE